MSFLNSVLSSISGDGTSRPSYPSIPVATSKTGQPGSSAASATKQQTTTNPTLKRKPDSELSNKTPAVARKDGTDSTSRPKAVPVAPSTTLASQVVSRSGPPKTKPAAVQAAQPQPAAASAPTGLKKGSYKEIMARAQAAKEAQAAFGQIKHKPVEKLTRRERLAQEAEMAEKAKALKIGKASKDAKVQSSAAAKEKPTSAKSDYKGTMRSPPENTYKGTMRPAGSAGAARKNTQVKESNSGPRPRYAYYSDEEEEEEDDGSDDSESMVGGGFDELEREEEESLRFAKREDEAARRQELAHQQEKAARKRKLMDLAAAARAKKR